MPRSLSSPAAEARRARDAALAGMRDPNHGSVVGRLFEMGKLNESQLNCARRFCVLVKNYHDATMAPRAPTSISFESTTAHPADCDSATGLAIAKRHARATENYHAALATLRAAPGVERTLERIVIRDCVPESWVELTNLKFALDRLGDHFSERRRAAR